MADQCDGTRPHIIIPEHHPLELEVAAESSHGQGGSGNLVYAMQQWSEEGGGRKEEEGG